MRGDFGSRLAAASERGGPIILAADYARPQNAIRETARLTHELLPHICAVKMNLQLLLPLDMYTIKESISQAQKRNLPCIADIKLNDIGNTNKDVCGTLWRAGFDAVIVNPIMGPEALSSLVRTAHDHKKGIISLCHMSSPEGAASYETVVDGRPLYTRFLEWGLAADVDGVIIGATYPDIIRECRHISGDNLDIISPGVGAQGGSAVSALKSGSDYVVVGRSLLESDAPAQTAKSLLA